MPSVCLISTEDLPHPVTETDLLVAALEARHIDAEIVSWLDASRDWSQPDLIVLRTPWDYFEKLDSFLHWLDSVAALTDVWNPPQIIKWNMHKRYLLELRGKQVPVIQTFLAQKDQHVTLTDQAVARSPHGLVIKPAISIGAIGAGRFASANAEAQAHLDALVKQGAALVQPFVPEVQTAGEVSLIFFGGEYSHAVLKKPIVGDYRVQAEYGGAVISYQPTDVELAVAQAAIDIVEASIPYVRVDMVTTADGPQLMELELIEPELFFPYAEGSAERFAGVIKAHLDG